MLAPQGARSNEGLVDVGSHGSISRGEAEKLVVPLGVGGFLLRDSSDGKGLVITLVAGVREGGGGFQCKHFKLKAGAEGGVEVNGKMFQSLPHLIEAGRSSAGEIKVVQKPAPNLHHFCGPLDWTLRTHSKFRINFYPSTVLLLLFLF